MWRHIKPILQVIILTTAMLVSFSHGWYWKTQQNAPELFIWFILYQTTTVWQELLTHILWWNLKSCYELKNKNPACFVVFLHIALYKKKPRMGQKHALISAHSVASCKPFILHAVRHLSLEKCVINCRVAVDASVRFWPQNAPYDPGHIEAKI